ncbi:MAG TPA: ribosome assembly RNA-binding protein YhbY [Gammaproteobacteria bacterium]|jgi:RNA-binding protein
MLKEKQKKTLRGLAHSRKPVVLMGNAGLTDGVLAALDEALLIHELVKVKVAAEDRQERDKIIQTMLERSNAELVQRVGHIATLFRRNQENPVITL